MKEVKSKQFGLKLSQWDSVCHKLTAYQTYKELFTDVMDWVLFIWKSNRPEQHMSGFKGECCSSIILFGNKKKAYSQAWTKMIRCEI